MKPWRPVDDQDPHDLRGIVIAIALGIGLGALVLFVATELGGAIGG